MKSPEINPNKQKFQNMMKRTPSFMGGSKGIRFEKPKDYKGSMKKLFQYIKVEKMLLIFGLFFAIFYSTISIFGPKLIGDIVNEMQFSLNFSTPLNLAQISKIGIILIMLYSFSGISELLQSLILAKVATRITLRFRSDISKKINKLPLRFFDNSSTGNIMSIITSDVDTVSNTLGQGIANLVSSIIKLLGVLIIMFVLCWQLALIALITLPLIILIMFLIIKSTQKFHQKRQDISGVLYGFIEEMYSFQNIIHINNGEERSLNNFKKINDEVFNNSYKVNFFSGLMAPLSRLIINLDYVLICLVGAFLVINNLILVGVIASFMIYIRQFHQPILSVSTLAGSFQTMAASAERIFGLLSEDEEEDENLKIVEIKRANIQGKVEFRNVNFGYLKDVPIIKNFSLTALPGQKIAIVGPTGAGKTTLVNLLMRFYEIDSGDILIDDVSIKDMKRRNVRRLFGMVLQDTWLFEGTIKENISYGKKRVTQEVIEEACKAANIDHFIKTTAESYNKIIDENTNLSQGQKQLLTIARAIALNNPMLILDEATSSVDTRTEILIQKAMDKLMKNRTSFIIAHRLSTIKNADKILVLNKGNIVEIGNHKELLEKNGFYAQLYYSQFELKA